MDTVIQSVIGIIASLALGGCFAELPPGVQRSDLLYLQSGGQLTQRVEPDAAAMAQARRLQDSGPVRDVVFHVMEGLDDQALG